MLVSFQPLDSDFAFSRDSGVFAYFLRLWSSFRKLSQSSIISPCQFHSFFIIIIGFSPHSSLRSWTLIMNRCTAYPKISIQRLKIRLWGISGFATYCQNPKIEVGTTRNWVASTFGTQQTLLIPHPLLSDHDFIYGYSVAFSRLWTWTLLGEIFISPIMKLVRAKHFFQRLLLCTLKLVWNFSTSNFGILAIRGKTWNSS